MISEEGAPTSRRNRLARETSPYLLQHADNPVDWYPWGPEALERAEREQRPILLSIGYSACHWCHVMERESFCDEGIARLMNEHFVCIKVDREERPDLDEIYMAATIAMSGSGGWPMTLFLTPQQEPFFAGTYFPPDDGLGRPGFRQLLERIAELWQTERPKLVAQAASLVGHVRERARPAAPMGVGQEAIDDAIARLGASFDSTHGGFGPAPKFPAPLALELLLRHHRRTGDPRSLRMVTTTLDAMARGGIRDHLGGGFARYSTDERWLVPHFEKMLYDNASLARIYAQAFQVTDDAEYRRAARETIDWVLREMRSEEGGFYSATDADSEGEEGKYFVWRQAEIAAALPVEQAAAFMAFYDVTEAGNWEGRSILHAPRPAREVALEVGCSVAELEARLGAAREKLLRLRSERVPPACDDKVLTGWNGLMIGALAECGRIFDEPRYVEAAERAAAFVWEKLRRSDGRLARTYREGEARHEGVLEDYAYLADGLLDLYEAGGDARWLEWVGELVERLVGDFGDENGGGFFATAAHHEPLLVRYRDGQDGAMPNPNAVTARALARWSFFAGHEGIRQRATDAIAAYGKLIERAPEAFAGALRVADLLLEGPVEVVLAGTARAEATRALRRQLARVYLPNRIIVHLDPAGAAPPVAAELVAGRGLLDGSPTAYVCRGFVCEAPVTDPAELSAALAEQRNQAEAARRASLSRSRLAGAASAAGTRRFAERHGDRFAESAYRQLGRTELWVSRLGFGGYRIDERAPEHAKALRAALRSGCNVIDTSTNYTDGDSERLVGSVLRELCRSHELSRDEILVVSKVGYVQGRNLELARAREREGRPFEQMVRYSEDCWHCIHPGYLADQLERSLERLGLETLDVYLLHNPEYFLSAAARRGGDRLERLRAELYSRFEQAFEYLESQVAAGRIRWYGVSSNSVAAGADDPEATDLRRMLGAAEQAGGAGHHFAVLQLPLNLLESRAALASRSDAEGTGGEPGPLEVATAGGLGVLVNRPLNAFSSQGLVRLAAPGPEVGDEAGAPSVSVAVDAVEQLEAEFAATFTARLRGSAARRVSELLRWAPELRRLDGRLTSFDQLRSIAYGQVLPRTTQVLAALEQAFGGAVGGELGAWQQAYRSALEGCFAALRGQIRERQRAAADSIEAKLDPLLPEARRAEPLSRKALWALASTPGVDVVLVGMRRPTYVDDAMGVMGWPSLTEVDAVYRAVS